MLTFLGDSGLPVSRLGLGLAALGRPGYINLGHAEDLDRDYSVAAMERRTHEVLSRAYALGVRYVDVARSYGRSEAFLASWLARQPELTVGSKWGYTYTADWQVEADKHEVKEHSLNKLNKQWQQSRALLGEHLNLYQIHSATLATGVLKNRAVLARLAELKAEGVAIGLSLSGPEQARTLRAALQVEVDGSRLFGAVQASFNVLEPSAGTVLKRAHSEGLGVIVKEALANGRLTNRNEEPGFADTLRALRTVADRLETTLDALALAFVLDYSWADVVLSGAATREQLESNVRALDVRLDDEARSVLAGLRETPTTYWRTRSALPWS